MRTDQPPGSDVDLAMEQIGVKACVFDAYGTLFDFAAAANGCRDVLGDAIDKLTALWRDKLFKKRA
jgi:FMN phosphatase YigB (HAD superfamily)